MITTSSSVLLALQLCATAPPGSTPSSEDLADAAPEMEWVPEGGDEAHGSDADPRVKQRKIRRAAITSVTGAAIAVVGVAGIVGGSVMLYLPRSKLDELRTDNGGTLPPGDKERQRAIATWQAAPVVLGVGLGVAVVGGIMAAVGGAKVRRLREDRRKTVAFSPASLPGGVGLSALGRF